MKNELCDEDHSFIEAESYFKAETKICKSVLYYLNKHASSTVMHYLSIPSSATIKKNVFKKGKGKENTFEDTKMQEFVMMKFL